LCLIIFVIVIQLFSHKFDYQLSSVHRMSSDVLLCVITQLSAVTSSEEPRRWETVSPLSQQSSADKHSSEVSD